MSRINPAPRSGVCAPPACTHRSGGACSTGGALPRPGTTDMQDNKPPVWSSQKSIMVAAIIALAVLFGGYQIGKDMALRDNALQAAGE
ncbi:hypothetical protein [Stenotrophomonas geniculata]|uniref:hypothetical protein n=1 Tax=Stenotrophomonas geniculata TaxID=86188 RepID=UPI002E762DB5|nr:hypothetical protein [Stenotrophomonas geniculata]